MRIDARETLKDMHRKVLSVLYECVCSADLSFFLTYTCANIYIVQLLLLLLLLLRSVDDLLSFFFIHFLLFLVPVCFSIYILLLDVNVARFDDAVYRNDVDDDDDDMTKREKEE